jgi:hypothetical protein
MKAKQSTAALVSGLILAGAALAAHAGTVTMSDSTPLIFPKPTNLVINSTADWSKKTITLKDAAFLMIPHEYQGHAVCVVDRRAGPGLSLNCEALLGHGRKQLFAGFDDFGSVK